MTGRRGSGLPIERARRLVLAMFCPKCAANLVEEDGELKVPDGQNGLFARHWARTVGSLR